MIILLLMALLVFVAIKYWGCWIGLCVLIRWMEYNQMTQPSDSKRRELTEWVISNIWKDLKKPVSK